MRRASVAQLCISGCAPLLCTGVPTGPTRASCWTPPLPPCPRGAKGCEQARAGGATRRRHSRLRTTRKAMGPQAADSLGQNTFCKGNALFSGAVNCHSEDELPECHVRRSGRGPTLLWTIAQQLPQRVRPPYSGQGSGNRWSLTTIAPQLPHQIAKRAREVCRAIVGRR